MIKSFQHRGLEQFFLDSSAKLLNPNHLKRIRRQLDALDAATRAEDMNYSGYCLHELKGERKGTWSIRVSENWRITFRFEDGNAHDVNLEDYH